MSCTWDILNLRLSLVLRTGNKSDVFPEFSSVFLQRGYQGLADKGEVDRGLETVPGLNGETQNRGGGERLFVIFLRPANIDPSESRELKSLEAPVPLAGLVGRVHTSPGKDPEPHGPLCSWLRQINSAFPNTNQTLGEFVYWKHCRGGEETQMC